MQRWTAVAFGALVVAAIGLLFVRPSGEHGPAPSASGSASASAKAGSSAGPTDAGAPGPSDAGATAEDPGSPIDTPIQGTSDAGATLLSGETPPALSGDAPKTVTFGVILVQYKGAQGATPSARSREAALDLAKQIAADAKQDFKAAIAKGDKGSNENMGKITRGFLEPAPEYVLFSLPKDGVSDPVDTPRGFWIVKRID